MVIVLDAGGRLVSWNRAAGERFHLEREEAPGARPQGLYQLCWASPDEQRAAFAEVLAGGAWVGHGTRVLDGERVDVETRLSALVDATEKTVGAVITIRHVTQRSCLEAAHADRSARVGSTSPRAEAGTSAICICASCQAMSDTGGAWQPAETYVGKRFDVAFTHGMCPECIQRFYPDLEQDGSASA